MAKDTFHALVRAGLEAEGWTITADPYRLEFERVKFEVDLAAEKVIAAEKGEARIAVEIKSFLHSSAVTDFYGALGQFLSYRLAMKELDSSRVLYLAIPLDSHSQFFQTGFARLAVSEYKLKLIVYDSIIGGLVQWII